MKLKSVNAHKKYMKCSTLLSLSFYALMVLCAFAANNAGEAFQTAVTLVCVSLFAFLMFFAPAYFAFKTTREKGNWLWLQLVHFVCCVPLWCAYFGLDAEKLSAEARADLGSIATGLFVIVVFATLAPLCGFLAASASKNLLGFR